MAILATYRELTLPLDRAQLPFPLTELIAFTPHLADCLCPTPSLLPFPLT